MSRRSRSPSGNGLIDRRALLRGAALAGAFLPFTPWPARAAAPPDLPDAMKAPGEPLSPYGAPAKYERAVTRTLIRSQPGTTGAGASRAPLEALEGTITPSGLHFERHHSGVPDINPATHHLLVHGMVRRPLVFTVDALLRYPMVSHTIFLECSGNSLQMYQPAPAALTAGQIHGLVSGSEWTGVPLSLILREAEVEAGAAWLLAEGGDAAAMSRSVPMAKALDDALLALFQNGERLRPENGYPVRLLLPGWEGNMSVKWLRRIKVTDTPTMTKDETSKYTDLQADGKALLFTYPMAVKSVITRPSPGLRPGGPGLYEVSGLAWSGSGTITRVDVSADGGRTWGEATLGEPVLPRALTRFRIPWQWDGRATVLKSRARDREGDVQPTREQFIAKHGTNAVYHYNAIQAWHVAANGEVKNVYA